MAVIASEKAEGAAQSFALQIISWQKDHGRNHLPWQNTRDPYKVWLSEIMLQQTQVATVIDYYARFLTRFPTVAALATAPEDEVLGLWSGLGYYSRARNMHKCAQQVVALHGGHFPRSSEVLQSLPGIGPSTAAAIASFCFAERVAILDGNVKRVLGRVLAFPGDLSEGRQVSQLWRIATSLLPDENLVENMPRYTQGLMDLGASICSPRKPLCILCPVQKTCEGFATGQPDTYPIKTRKLKRSSQQISLLWAQRPDGAVWLERRPVSGIWGGLYCLPTFESEEALNAFLPQDLRERTDSLRPFKHVLTHKDLHIHPVIAGFSDTQEMPALQSTAADSDVTGAWFGKEDWRALGLPAPIRKLLEEGAV